MRVGVRHTRWALAALLLTAGAVGCGIRPTSVPVDAGAPASRTACPASPSAGTTPPRPPGSGRINPPFLPRQPEAQPLPAAASSVPTLPAPTATGYAPASASASASTSGLPTASGTATPTPVPSCLQGRHG